MKQRDETLRPFLRPRVSFTQTFESSQNEREEKFAIDRTLARGIMENKSSIIVQEHTQSIRIQNSQLDEDEEYNKMLLQYRIKYDKVRTESLQIEGKINQNHEDLKRLKDQYELLNKNRKEIDWKYIKTKNELAENTQNLDQLVLAQDVRREMENRLKSDILFYKKRIFDLNLQLLKKHSEIKLHTSKSSRQKRISVRCKNLLTSVEKTFNSNQQARSNQISTVSEILSTKKEYLLKKRERSYQFSKSMMSVLCGKLPEQKEHERLLHANRLMKRILHFKMEKLMKTYKEVSNSFNQIKAYTSIKDVDEFVYNYMNKNQIYNELSEKISELEPKLEILQQQKKLLQSQHAFFIEQAEEIIELMKKQKDISLKVGIETIQKLNQQTQKISKLKNGWMNWALSTMAMLKNVSRGQIRSKYGYLGNLLGDCLRLILKNIQTNEQKQTSISESVLNQFITRSNLGLNDFLSRNIRIKTLGNESTYQEQEEGEYDLLSQKDYLHLSRRAMKKQRARKAIPTRS